MRYLLTLLFATVLLSACNNSKTGSESDTDANASFNAFKEHFIDAYWKQNPSAAIYAGYGKYYDILKVPDSAAFAGDVQFSKNYLDSLGLFKSGALTAPNQVDQRILENALRSTIWYIDTLKQQQWDPTFYNIGSECYEIITRPFAPLNERLQMLSSRLKNAGAYYSAALQVIRQPTREHTRLAIRQNNGSLEVFGTMLSDSVKQSTLNQAAKDSLLARAATTTNAIKYFADSLQRMLDDSTNAFRDFRIGEELFNAKFRYDIVSDYTPRQMFDKAMAAKASYHRQMFGIADSLWTKYCGNEAKPADSLLLIKKVIDNISLHHIAPKDVFETLKKQVHDMSAFIVQKQLFDFDTTSPVEIRKMPAFASGFSMASANFPPPYQKDAVSYYNIADLSAMPADKAESQLRENNDYILQILTIHEGVPGHCLQGIYNAKKSKSIVPAIFSNGAMVEGWAVYSQRMMLENGWANNAPEMWLMFYKWSLRECCNVITDYGLHCLNYSKEDILKLLRDEAFQQEAQIEEKYHRATVSQVQLCSYFTGASEILDLREAFKKKEGDKYSLKNFHEQFLSYGCAPVKYIREIMLK